MKLASKMMKASSRTPVLVGVKTVIQREEDPTTAKDTVELMAEAVLGAAADAQASDPSILGEPSVLSELDEVISMSSMTKMVNPAAQVMEKVMEKIAQQGVMRSPKTTLAEVGVLQQAVFDRACRSIQEDNAQAVLVIGGEAQYRALRAKIIGVEVPDPPTDSETPPDAVMEPGSAIVHPLEIEMGLYTAPTHYAFLENAFGYAEGFSPKEQRSRTAKLWEGFNRVAGENPTAHFPQPRSTQEIETPTEKNRVIAAPYNKWNCSQINVDQASALLFVSAELADRMQIPDEKRIYPHIGVVSNHMVPIVKRRELERCPGFKIVGEKALGAAAVGGDLGKINHIDLYSCFPVAVWVQAKEMGISTERPLTVTGGMTFGGGPLNSYVLGSLVRMANVLRGDAESEEGKESLGLVTSISGMISKQGAGIWSTHPPKESPQFFDLSDETRKATEVCEVDEKYTGEAEAVSSTLLYDREGNPEKAVCIANTKGGERTMAFSNDPELLSLLAGEDYLGRMSGMQIDINSDRKFSLL